MKTSAGRCSILLVEDDEMVLGLLSQAIAMKFPHMAIHSATNGRAGLDLFRVAQCTMIITDIGMPGMDGIHMLREIVAVKEDVRVVIISAYGDGAVRERTEKAGIEIHRCLQKPLEYKKLFSAIDEIAT